MCMVPKFRVISGVKGYIIQMRPGKAGTRGKAGARGYLVRLHKNKPGNARKKFLVLRIAQ